MQALEKIGVLEQDEEKGGRRITQSGQRDLDRESLPHFRGSCNSDGAMMVWRSRRWKSRATKSESAC